MMMLILVVVHVALLPAARFAFRFAAHFAMRRAARFAFLVNSFFEVL
ncbi:MAG: hypothetical protein LBG47_00445 [Prevotellaceae bacterium]|jgi:hypothetical protein|nr:hypothetical protein [Prevotellaceae bacterium]